MDKSNHKCRCNVPNARKCNESLIKYWWRIIKAEAIRLW